MNYVALILLMIALSGCAEGVGSLNVQTISDYCQRYQRQVLTKDEVAEVKKLSQSLRRRIQGNDVDYLCACVGWKDAICKSAQKSR
jgi:hypothetical protein